MSKTKTPLFEGVGDAIVPVTSERSWAHLEVTGKGDHISSALKRTGWDGRSPTLSVLITTELGAIKGSEYVMRGNLGLVPVPLRRVQDPEKIDHSLVVNLDLTDLSKVKFPTLTSPAVGAPNHSVWEDGVNWVKSLTTGGVTYTDEADIRANQFMSESGFCLR